MSIVTIGIDFAKNVFADHGVEATGKPVLVRLNLPRSKLFELIASLPPGASLYIARVFGRSA